MRGNTILMATVLFFATAASIGVEAAESRHFSFAYDQPHTTAYGIAADIFANKLQELSKVTMVIDQFPGAQLGQEPQVLQKLRTGDIDFAITSTANSATVQPEAGGVQGDDEFKGRRRPHPGARDHGVPGYLQQARDP
jgi:TRAP-type C4-dicarboxylate transport system substrate-binding protein